jgi:hypothetical protein
VSHTFEDIGEKTIQLNAKQVDSVQLIILAMEDVSERKGLEGKLAVYTKQLEVKVIERTRELEARVQDLEQLNRTMVDRELKMIDLKKELEDLKGKK